RSRSSRSACRSWFWSMVRTLVRRCELTKEEKISACGGRGSRRIEAVRLSPTPPSALQRVGCPRIAAGGLAHHVRYLIAHFTNDRLQRVEVQVGRQRQPCRIECRIKT